MDYRVETIRRRWLLVWRVQLLVLTAHSRMQGIMAFDRAGHHGAQLARLDLAPGELVEYSHVGLAPVTVGDRLTATDPALQDKLFRRCAGADMRPSSR